MFIWFVIKYYQFTSRSEKYLIKCLMVIEIDWHLWYLMVYQTNNYAYVMIVLKINIDSLNGNLGMISNFSSDIYFISVFV